MKPNAYEFFCPVKIVCGTKALANLPYEMRSRSLSRAFVVTDAGVRGAGLLAKVVSAFEGSGCAIGALYDQTPVDSSTRVTNLVAGLYRDSDCDCLVAVGGGSVIDTAKGVSVVVGEGIDDLLRVQGADRIEHPLVPVFVVPTTAGTGSEVTSALVIKDEASHAKIAMTSPRLYPVAAIVDPAMTASMPPKLTAATGMDALTHACEAYYCLMKNPVSDAFAEAAIRLIAGNLVAAVKDGRDERARLAMANAALLAGIAFSNSMVGIVHALAHAVGAVAYVPHGVANAILLPHGMENNLKRRAAAIAGIAPLLGVPGPFVSDQGGAEAAVRAVRTLASELNAACGLPQTLSAAGVRPEQLDDIARTARDDGSLMMNPEEADLADLKAILQRAM